MSRLIIIREDVQPYQESNDLNQATIREYQKDKQLNRIILHYEYIIKAYIKRFRMKQHEYEDIMQEGRIGIYKAFKTFCRQGGASLTTYIATCVRNALISYIRKGNTKKAQIYRNTVSYDAIENGEELLVSTNQNIVEDEVMVKLTYQNAYQSVKDKTDPLELEIFNKYNFGYTIQELSEQYDIPKKRLYVILARTRKKIMEKLDDMNVL